MGREKKIFLAATRQNDGKTVVCVGLMGRLSEISGKTGFIKPIGQRYVEVDGDKIDEDAVLIKSMLGCDSHLKDMSPVAIGRGFTKRYLDKGNVNSIIHRIREAYDNISRDKDIVVIEGTGHAGVGSVIDLNNAQVAKLLGARVILVSVGGIGRPIDEIALNQALFEKEGVEIIGVIINKVIPEKKEETEEYLRKGLAKKGIELLGVIPYTKSLTAAKMSQLGEALGLEFLCGEHCMDNYVENVTVGAMFPHNALKYIDKKSLLVTPGDREDLILAAIGSSLLSGMGTPGIAGLILTGGLIPDEKIVEILRKANIPVLLSNDNTYRVASKLHDLVVKIRVEDRVKIETAKELVEQNVDTGKIFEKLC